MDDNSESPLFVIPMVMPASYYGDDYDMDSVSDFITQHNGTIEIYYADIADLENPLKMTDFTFDSVSDKMHENMLITKYS
jgi:hypothetical protein